MSTSAALHSEFSDLEARMAAFRERAKAITLASARGTPAATAATPEEKTAPPATARVAPIKAATSAPPPSMPLTARVRTQSYGGSGSDSASSPPLRPSSSSSAAPLGSGPALVALSNIGRHDDGWSSQGEEGADWQIGAGRGTARARLTRAGSGAGGGLPSSSPTGSGLVLAYKSDGEGGGGGGVGSARRASHSRRPSLMQAAAEEAHSWAEAQAAQKALLAARRRRELSREEEAQLREQQTRERTRRDREEAARLRELESEMRGRAAAVATGGVASPSSGTSASLGAGAASPLSARSGAEGREVLGALARLEQRRAEEQLARGGEASGLLRTPRQAHTPSARRSRTPRRRALEQEDEEGESAARPSLPSSGSMTSRGPEARSASAAARGGSMTSRAPASSAATSSAAAAAARRRAQATRKQQVNARKEAALAAITSASTPVSSGGTLELHLQPLGPGGPQSAKAKLQRENLRRAQQQMREAGLTYQQLEQRSCDVQQACVVQ